MSLVHWYSSISINIGRIYLHCSIGNIEINKNKIHVLSLIGIYLSFKNTIEYFLDNFSIKVASVEKS